MQPKGPMGPWAHAGPKGPAYKLGAWCRSAPTGGIHFQKWVLDFEGMDLSMLNMFSSVLGGPIPLWGYPPFSNCRPMGPMAPMSPMASFSTHEHHNFATHPDHSKRTHVTYHT